MEIFGTNRTNPEDKKKGLCVTFEELLEEQKYLPYLSLKNNKYYSHHAGDVKSAFKGRGMEFEEVRMYMFGDDVRDIDWRVTARKREPYTKVFGEEKDRQITVLLDLSASMIFGTRRELKSVSACKIAALLGWLTLHNRDRFGILIYNGKNMKYFKPQNNPRGILAILKTIAQQSYEILQHPNVGDISEALQMLEYYQKGRGTVFILSDFHNYNAMQSAQLSILAKHNLVYCVNIFDIVEEQAPAQGVYAVQYNGQKVVFNSETPEFREEYRKHFAENREKLKNNCRKFLCKYIEIRTDIPIFKQLRLS